MYSNNNEQWANYPGLLGTRLRDSALLHLGNQIVKRIFVVAEVFCCLVLVGWLARLCKRLLLLGRRCGGRNWTRISGGFLWGFGSLSRFSGRFVAIRTLIGQSASRFFGEKERERRQLVKIQISFHTGTIVTEFQLKDGSLISQSVLVLNN